MVDQITKIQPFSLIDGPEIQLPSNETWQFDKSLNVAVTGMRIFGIPLDVSSIRSPYLRFWSVWFGRIFFITNFALNIIIFNETMDGESVKVFTTSDWNKFIAELNFSIALIMTNIALLGWMGPNWKELVKVLHRIERLDLFQPDDYKMFTRYFNIGSFSLIFLVIFHLIQN